jgi:hypothetical protein
MQLGAILSCLVGSQEDTFLHCIPLYLPYTVIAAPKYRDLQWTSLMFYMAGFVDGFDSWILKRYVILLVKSIKKKILTLFRLPYGRFLVSHERYCYSIQISKVSSCHHVC